MKPLLGLLKKTVSKYAKFIYFDHQWEQQFAYKNRFLLQVDDEIRIVCYKDSYISKLLYEGNFERHEIAFIRQFLRPNEVFLDIGANIGYHALVAATRLSGGEVYAFEPTPATYERLLENIRENGFENVVALAKAFSDKPGKFAFHQYLNGRDAFNSFGNIFKNLESETIEVETTTIDLFMNSGAVKGNVSLIKIDVEGWEYPVLKGGLDYLAQKDAPALMVEFNDKNARKAGFNCQQIYDLGQELGYSWMEIGDAGLAPSRKKSFYKYQNLLAIKDVESVKERLAHSNISSL